MKKLRELRKEKGISMKAFGKDLGFAESTVSLYETGKREPDFETLKKFAEYYDVTTDYILGVDDSKHPKTETHQTETNDEPQSKLERKLVVLSRNAKNMSEEERKELTEYFEKTIDIYLKSKGIDPKEF